MKLVIGAMSAELQVVIETFQAKKVTTSMIEEYVALDHDLVIGVTGIGLVNASLGLSYLLTKYPEVELVINIGTSGTNNLANQQGDLLLIEQATYLTADVTGFGYQYGQIPQMPAFYQADQTTLLAVGEKLKVFKPSKANVASSDIFINDDQLITNQLEQLPIAVQVFDMEATAYFQTAFVFHKRMISIKIVSDVLGQSEDNEKQFDEFLVEAAEKISKVIELII
jgi:adenosylhomocysteine nucleosidase